MEKVLLVLAANIVNREDFEQIIQKFEDHDFLICLYDGIEPANLNLDILPDLVANLRAQYPDLTAFTVLSNIRWAIFSWYRCYNSLIADFIYFIDRSNGSEQEAEKLKPPFGLLSQFAGINQEKPEGKIYLNLDLATYPQMIMFLLADGHYRYFRSIDQFDFTVPCRKNLLIKEYSYQGQIYPFNFATSVPVQIERIVIESAELNRTLQLSAEYLKELQDNDYLIKYFVLYFYRQNNANEVLVNLFRWIEEIFSYPRKYALYQEFMDYLHTSSADFYEQAYLLSLLSLLSIQEESFLTMVMRVLARDHQYLEYHYTLLFNTVFYFDNCNKRLFKDYFAERDRELKRLGGLCQSCLPAVKPPAGKRLAIFIDQLKTLLHSPTKLLLDYLLALEQYYPEYELKVFVEDNFACNAAEGLLPWLFKSEFSVGRQTLHRTYLGQSCVEIIYVNPDQSKRERTQQIVQHVHRFAPEALIFFGCDCSLSRACLYRYFPTIYLAIGFFAFSKYADIYLCGNRVELLQELKTNPVIDQNAIYEFVHGFIAPLAKRTFERSAYYLANDDVLLVTVGNRLDVEMEPDYIDLICRYIDQVEEVKWLIIGPQKIRYIAQKYSLLVEKQKIILQDYEEDLAGLYGICDIYLNPDRNGGGYTIGTAMSCQIPVVTLNRPTGARRFIGAENTAGTTMEEYLAELELLVANPDYRARKGQLMRERVNRFTLENAVGQLIPYVAIAQEKFLRRTNEAL